MAINKEVTKDELIAALRSGKYVQTEGKLLDHEDDGIKYMCCLGVLADLQGHEFVWADEHHDFDGYGYYGNVNLTGLHKSFRVGLPAPADLPSWLNWQQVASLAGVNDNSAKVGITDYADVIQELENM